MAVQACKSPMVRLNKTQLATKINFINNYMSAQNAADGSIFDPNSNVANKNVATMLAELNKDINIQIERKLIYDRLVKLWGNDIADKYLEQLEKHEIYCHDETAPIPYCVAISMYPFLEKGLCAFGGETKAPKHLSSFNGGFVNLIFAVSSQFCGAVATVEYLMCFDHFARKDYGDNYLEEHTDLIKQELQQVVYALNQPASARGNQSPFWNVSIFDKYYFDALFSKFYFPDGDQPKWDSLNKLQQFFMHWFNEERTRALLTFPVVTVALLNNDKEVLDKEYEEFTITEMTAGNAFFIYTSNTVDSLSSCCFKGEEKITYRDKNGEEFTTTLAEYVESKISTQYIDTILDNGDTILSYDPDTHAEEWVKITGILKKPYKGHIYSIKVGKQLLRVTEDHLFWVQNKDTGQEEELSAKDLEEVYTDYRVWTSEGIYRDIFLVHPSSLLIDGPVYDIQLETNHYFFANGILTHNCRLRNSIADQMNDFSYSLGAGGIMTGSMNVLTINMNRFIQDHYKPLIKHTVEKEPLEWFFNALRNQIRLLHQYQIAFKVLFKEYEENKMLPAYTAHYIELDKQYLTNGVNGIMEGLEYMGLVPDNNAEYKALIHDIFNIFDEIDKESTKKYAEYKVKFNTEIVPAENLGVKFASWDKKDGYEVPRDCYNSYLYPVEDENISILDKIILHGRETTEKLDGGSALHLNLEEYPTKENCKKILEAIVQEGCPYFCTNIKITICNDCNNIDKRTLKACPKCGSTNIDYATRIIGYLRRVSNFSKDRQIEEGKRKYMTTSI